MSPPPADDRDAEHLERLERERSRHPTAAGIPPPASAADASRPGPLSRRGGLWGALAALGLLLAKFKVVLLVGLKFLKLGKVAATGLTMVLTIWVYAQTWGAPFAIGFVALIFVHEMGHAVALRARGLRAGAPVFIPFVGALIAMKEMPPNARVEAEVAIAGPLAGGLAAALCWALGRALGSALLEALAFSGFFLNLFNLLPVSPLDGGRIAGAISRWLWVGGIAVAAVVATRTTSPLLWAIVVLGGIRAVQAFRGKGNERPGYFDLSEAERAAIAVGYFGLAGLLAAGAFMLAPAASG